MTGLRNEIERHLVKDLVPNEIGLLFVLESPHTDEVRAKVPLAGSSGIMVTEVLKVALDLGDDSVPFGKLVKENLKEYKIGVMNASPIPMQTRAYTGGSKLALRIGRMLEIIRKNPQPRKRKTKYGTPKEVNRTISFIKRSFSRRVHKARIDGNTIVILCGSFSKYIWHECVKNRTKDVIELPHPSKGLWCSQDNVTDILKLKGLVRSSRASQANNSLNPTAFSADTSNPAG